LGELRWREPQPVAAWTGIRDAAAFSVACTQLSEGWNIRYVPSSAEDCLYLNVAAPVWPTAAKVPVMVWIHGGSNTAGSGEAAGFDQRTLVRRELVLVTINTAWERWDFWRIQRWPANRRTTLRAIAD
jgi:para-nitrobenzyl esterase